MKNFIFSLGICLITMACSGSRQADRASASGIYNNEEATNTDSAYSHYGKAIDPTGAIPSSELLATLGDQEEVRVKVAGEVAEVCKMKGCWMIMKLGDDDEMRVTFKDYAFFVPKDTDGKKVIIDGTLKKESVDVATLRHYAEDAGKSIEEIEAIGTPEEKYTFVADGVIII